MSAMQLTLAQAAGWLTGAQVVGDSATAVARVHSDTRTLRPGDLFVALKGERFDAAQFLAQARTQGAVAALCQRDARGLLEAAGLPGILVDDVRRALGELAHGWRRQFELPLIAVTGSNGKTTVTQMIASILRAWQGDGSLATQGNFNNDIGLPLTLLRLRPEHRAAVVELGMNHPGEIAQLAAIAEPTVALVNNAQREHQEFMASVEAVAAENGSVFGALRAGGAAVFPAGDTYQNLWSSASDGCRQLLFGEQSAGAQVFTRSAAWSVDHWQLRAATPAGDVQATVHVAGRHNVRNALAALACASAAGVPVAAMAAGLSAFRAVAGRSRALRLEHAGRAIVVIDDSYNANPDSVRAAIDVLAELPGPRLLVLGDMGEVGDQGPAFHVEVGEHARQQGIERLFTHGTLARHAVDAFGAGARHFDDMAALQAAACAALDEVASIVVKGSRFMKMERVLQALGAGEAAKKGVAHAG